MRINKASTASGVSTGMIRRYEQMGLLPPPPRSENGYRDYSSDDVHRIRFIQTFNDMGFELAEIKQLLSPWDESGQKDEDLKGLALVKAQEIHRRVQILVAAEKALMQAAERIAGSAPPEDPIRAFAALGIQL